MKKELVFLFIILTLVSCTKNPTISTDFKIIKLTYDKDKIASLSDFVESNKVILLDDTNENYIGNISNLDVNDSLIIITDNITNSVFIYEHCGKLSCVIKSHGRGPGEFLSIQSTWFDHETGEVFVYDRNQHKILAYNLGGKLVSEFSSPGYICDFATNNGEFKYYYRSMDGYPDDNVQPSNFHLILTSPDSIRLSMEKDFFMDNNVFLPYKNFSKSNNAIFLLTPQEQNIYELSGMTKKLKYHIELGPDPEWKENYYKSLKTYEDWKTKKKPRINKVGGLHYMASDRYILFCFSKHDSEETSSLFYAIYDMYDNLEVLSFQKLINDIDGFTHFFTPVFFNDSIWISTFHQYQFDNTSLKAIEEYYGIDFSKSINPILVISKLKLNE